MLDTFVLRLVTMIRAPSQLREDIADEIADHLASHVEEQAVCAGRNTDATTLQAEAIRAFGDPQAVARELRNIHMGDWIMFQKIMVAALVVIVISMATTAYFSWSAAHQQGRQLEQMNQQLASLVELQQTAPQRAIAAAAEREAAERREEANRLREKMEAAASPRAPVYFYQGEKSKPAVNYAVEVGWSGRQTQTELTNAGGLISLPLGNHQIHGAILRPDGTPYDKGRATWSRVVKVSGQASEPVLDVDVSPPVQCRFELDLSAVTWDPDIPRPVEIWLSGQAGEYVTHPDQGRGSVPDRSFFRTLTLDGTGSGGTTAEGIYPGKATATVCFRAGPDDIQLREAVAKKRSDDWRDRPILTCSIPVDIPADGGTIPLKVVPASERQITGVLFEGSREHPVAGRPLTVVHYAAREALPNQPLPPYEEVILEYLRTTARGEFVQLGSGYASEPFGFTASGLRVIRMAWHTADGREAQLIWPFAMLESYELANNGVFHEVDLARLGTLRVTFTGIEALLAAGRTIAEPLLLQPAEAPPAQPGIRLPPPAGRPQSNVLEPLTRQVDLRTTPTADLLMFEPKSDGYALRLTLVTARPKEDAPDLIAHVTHQRQIGFEVIAGRVTELEIAVDKLDEWQASSPEWHRVVASPTDSRPQSAG